MQFRNIRVSDITSEGGLVDTLQNNQRLIACGVLFGGLFCFSVAAYFMIPFGYSLALSSIELIRRYLDGQQIFASDPSIAASTPWVNSLLYYQQHELDFVGMYSTHGQFILNLEQEYSKNNATKGTSYVDAKVIPFSSRQNCICNCKANSTGIVCEGLFGNGVPFLATATSTLYMPSMRDYTLYNSLKNTTETFQIPPGWVMYQRGSAIRQGKRMNFETVSHFDNNVSIPHTVTGTAVVQYNGEFVSAIVQAKGGQKPCDINPVKTLACIDKCHEATFAYDQFQAKCGSPKVTLPDEYTAKSIPKPPTTSLRGKDEVTPKKKMMKLGSFAKNVHLQKAVAIAKWFDSDFPSVE